MNERDRELIRQLNRELGELKARVAAIDKKLDEFVKEQREHDERLRDLEKFRYGVGAVIAVTVFIVTAIGGIVVWVTDLVKWLKS
jgi:uncharacterized protein YlxW (UPF0749 family)